MIPFANAAHEHTEPFANTVAVAPSASAQVFEMVVPSYGYLRHIFLEVTAAGGTGGTYTAATAAESPFNILDAITLLDTNGAPLFGPVGGFQCYWANAIGGYAYQNNVKNSPWYVGTSPNFAFGLRVPVEITHDTGLGAVANQNAAAAYKLRFTIQPTSVVWSAAPAPLPTITVRPQLEAWSLPNEVDALGRPQEQTPPNHGTIQYWSATRLTTSSGNQYNQVTRVGNLIRNLVFMGRTSAPTLSDTVLPNPLILSWDARQLHNETQNYRSQVAWERMLGQSRDAGVMPYQFDHFPGNKVGDDDPTGWIPTVQATRLELQGTAAAGGTIEILVNDVAPVALDQSNRYVETSGSGFHPNPDTPTR